MTDEELFKRLPSEICALILSKPEDVSSILKALKAAYASSPSRPLLRYMALSYVQLHRDDAAIKCYEYEEENFGVCTETLMALLSLYQGRQNWEKVFFLARHTEDGFPTPPNGAPCEIERQLFLFFRRACLNLKKYKELVRYERGNPGRHIDPYRLVDEGILTLWGSDVQSGLEMLDTALSQHDVFTAPEAYNFGVAHMALGLVKAKRYKDLLSDPRFQNHNNLSGLRAEAMFSIGKFDREAWDHFEESYKFDLKRTPLWREDEERKVTSKSDFAQNSKILIWGNQGIGDQLGLVSALNRALSAGAFDARITIAIDRKIVCTSKKIFPKFDFIGLDEVRTSGYDFHYPLSSVLRYFLPETWISKDQFNLKQFKPSSKQERVRVFVPNYSNKFKIIDIIELIKSIKNLLTQEELKKIIIVYGGYSSPSHEVKKYMLSCNFMEFNPSINYKDDVEKVADIIRTCDFTVGVANSYTILSGLLGVRTVRLSAEPDTGLRFNLLENTASIELNAADDINYFAATMIKRLVFS